MTIYEMYHNTHRTKGYPYAYGYGPLPYSIPFLQGDLLERRRALWEIHPRQPGLEVAETGSKWGDFMLCGCGLPSVVYSDRVLTSLKILRHHMLTETQFPVGKVKSRKLRCVPPPRYFACQWSGGIEVDWHATGVELDSKGLPIFGLNIPPRVAKLSTWNGDDIFSWTNWDVTHLTMLCTEKVVELAEKEKWTNVRFDPVLTS